MEFNINNVCKVNKADITANGIDVDTFEHGYVNKIFKNINMEG